jgi:NTE family protein
MAGAGPRIGIALGGGAARGLAHLGVLDVLLKAGIRPDVVVGTSFGALVGGAVLAADWKVEHVLDEVLEYVEGAEFKQSQLNFFRKKKEIEKTGFLYNLRDLIKRGIYYGFASTRTSFIAPEDFRRSIDAVVPDIRIEDMSSPFAAVAADIGSGEELVLDRGSLRVAVRASCAIPGVLPPIRVGHGRTCIDGGWVNKVPAETALALGAEFVIAVDVSDDLADTVDMTSGLNVITRGDAILSHRLKTLQLTRADHVVKVPLAHVDWADFPRAAEIVGIGRMAAEESLAGLRADLAEASSLGPRLRRAADRSLRKRGLVRRRRPVAVTAEALDVPQPEPVEDEERPED